MPKPEDYRKDGLDPAQCIAAAEIYGFNADRDNEAECAKDVCEELRRAGLLDRGIYRKAPMQVDTNTDDLTDVGIALILEDLGMQRPGSIFYCEGPMRRRALLEDMVVLLDRVSDEWPQVLLGIESPALVRHIAEE